MGIKQQILALKSELDALRTFKEQADAHTSQLEAHSASLQHALNEAENKINRLQASSDDYKASVALGREELLHQETSFKDQKSELIEQINLLKTVNQNDEHEIKNLTRDLKDRDEKILALKEEIGEKNYKIDELILQLGRDIPTDEAFNQADNAIRKILYYIRNSKKSELVGSYNDLSLIINEIYPKTRRGYELLNNISSLSDRAKSWLLTIEITNLLKPGSAFYEPSHDPAPSSPSPAPAPQIIETSIPVTDEELYSSKQLSVIRNLIIGQGRDDEELEDDDSDADELTPDNDDGHAKGAKRGRKKKII
jgi:predicted  nucleic acid-binding Zn-ribbon protein